MAGDRSAGASGAATTTIVWFRRDLRVEDNPALAAAAKVGLVVPIFIWCAEEEGEFRPGRVSRWWLKQSLIHLASSLHKLGCTLLFFSASDSLSVLLRLVTQTKASHVFYNHLYDPVSLIRDHRVKQGLSQYGIPVRTFNADLLYEPWEVIDEQGTPYTRYQEFWNKYMSMDHDPDGPLLPPKRISSPATSVSGSVSIEELGLEDDYEKSSNAILSRNWTPGWANANKALEAFVAGPLADYQKNRNKVDGGTTSMLSPHLHYGEISIRKVFHMVRSKQLVWSTDNRRFAEHSAGLFLKTLGFREYSRYLCFHFPFTHERSLLGHLRHFPWRVDEGNFKAWRQGRTGYPLVDAGMRQLWATGWLHNRIRVIVSSFCVKFLQLPWRWGMKYFWDTLLDADLESDILGWQYISGSLPDGHELDRMEIPHFEGRRFDPEGNYVRRWLPELARLPTEWIHEPWNAPPGALYAAGIELGCNYPRPIVEIAAARVRLQQGLVQMWEHNNRETGSNSNQQQENENRLPERQQQGPASSESSHPDQIVPNLPNESVLSRTRTLNDAQNPVVPLRHQPAIQIQWNFNQPQHQDQQRHQEQQHLHQQQQHHHHHGGGGGGDNMMESDHMSTAESSSAFRRNYDGYAAASTTWFLAHNNSNNRRRVDSSSYL